MLLKFIQKFRKPKVQRIVISFIPNGKGTVNTEVKMDKTITVGMAVYGLDKVKADISKGLAERVYRANLGKRNPKQRTFIRQQTLGDIL